MRIVCKTFTVCNDDIAIFQYFDASITEFAQLTPNGIWTAPDTYNSMPSWFTAYNNGFGSYESYSFFPSEVPIGSFPISFSGTDGNEYIIAITKTATCEVIVFENKCGDNLNVVWLNNIGGRENYIFCGVRQIVEVTDGNSDTFKTQDLTIKNSQLQDVYNLVVANTGKIPKEHLVKLESLRTSIQAWLYDEKLPAYYEYAERFTAIILDRESMVVSDTKEKVVERSIRFRIAKEINVQGQ